MLHRALQLKSEYFTSGVLVGFPLGGNALASHWMSCYGLSAPAATRKIWAFEYSALGRMIKREAAIGRPRNV